VEKETLRKLGFSPK